MEGDPDAVSSERNGKGCTVSNWHGKKRTHNGEHRDFRTLPVQIPEEILISFCYLTAVGERRGMTFQKLPVKLIMAMMLWKIK